MQRARAAAWSGETACGEPWTQKGRKSTVDTRPCKKPTIVTIDSGDKINTVQKRSLVGDVECLHLDSVT